MCARPPCVSPHPDSRHASFRPLVCATAIGGSHPCCGSPGRLGHWPARAGHARQPHSAGRCCAPVGLALRSSRRPAWSASAIGLPCIAACAGPTRQTSPELGLLASSLSPSESASTVPPPSGCPRPPDDCHNSPRPPCAPSASSSQQSIQTRSRLCGAPTALAGTTCH